MEGGTVSGHSAAPWTLVGHGPWIIANGGATVALVSADGAHTNANAHLVSAAPELLEIVRDVLDYGVPRFNARCRAAIAKAEGREP